MAPAESSGPIEVLILLEPARQQVEEVRGVEDELRLINKLAQVLAEHEADVAKRGVMVDDLADAEQAVRQDLHPHTVRDEKLEVALEAVHGGAGLAHQADAIAHRHRRLAVERTEGLANRSSLCADRVQHLVDDFGCVQPLLHHHRPLGHWQESTRSAARLKSSRDATPGTCVRPRGPRRLSHARSPRARCQAEHARGRWTS